MKQIFYNFLLMVQFLTRIPVNLNLPCEKDNFRDGSIFLPLIGLLVGVIQWITYEIFIKILPINSSIVIVLLIGIIVTGALHIDGLGDTCDGFFALKGNDRIIEIMKDSRIGTYACIVIVVDLLLKFTLVTFIAPKFSVGIIAAPVIGRFSLLFLAFKGKNAKSTGSGNLFINNVGVAQLFIGFIITLGILVLIMNPKYVILLLLAAIFLSFVFNIFCMRKIGGLTGDTLGANNELVETLILISIAIILKLGI